MQYKSCIYTGEAAFGAPCPVIKVSSSLESDTHITVRTTCPVCERFFEYRYST